MIWAVGDHRKERGNGNLVLELQWEDGAGSASAGGSYAKYTAYLVCMIVHDFFVSSENYARIDQLMLEYVRKLVGFQC